MITNPAVAEDYAWQLRFRDHFAEIAVGVVRVQLASWDEDTKRNTDMVVGTLANGHRIACRARRRDASPGQLLRWTQEFTIRSSRPSRAQTELAKIQAGWGDYMIYGFEFEPDSDRLHPWVLLNLHLLREYLNSGGRWSHQKNIDGTEFAAFRASEIPLGCVLNSDGYPPTEPANGPCQICGRPSWQVNPDGCPLHVCCTTTLPGLVCEACRQSDAQSNYRYGWPP